MALTDRLEALEPTKRVTSLLDEFKAFAFKGNVVDLAVGVIIGAAFGAIIKSLVDNIIMPLISLLIPADKGYENWAWVVKSHVENGQEVADKVVPFGKFLAEVLNFVIVAAVLFLFVKKFLGWLIKTKKDEPIPPPTKDQQLLIEIRDLLTSERAAGSKQ
jgi:large conductance mechanosensitive channel